MKSITKLTLAAIILHLVAATKIQARENAGGNTTNISGSKPAKITAGCTRTTAQIDLSINNVRARILVPDMWWDFNNPQYEIPKGSKKHSLFAGCLWVGGTDVSGQIKVAGQTYRQATIGGGGVDFWGGPMDTTNNSISPERCLEYDRHWKISRDVVNKFRIDKDFTPTTEEKELRDNILSWPGNGPSSSEALFLAPFEDLNNNSLYEPELGEYPRYNLTGEFPNASPTIPKVICNDYVFGDQTIWWVFNDVGNAHENSKGEPIGLEIRAQAFAFKTNDEINNMTFYKYQIINRSTFVLKDTYFGQWADPDVGNDLDDYVGCDVDRGLGFSYNGDEDDQGAKGYGLNPPAIGIDFFQGPAADIGDTTDNDRDGCVDCTFLIDAAGNTINVPDTDLPEQIIMSKFVYYNNTNNAPDGNPDGASDYYNYLRGIWGDGLPMTYGGNGRDQNNPVCNYMFPGITDPDFRNTPWTEVIAGNQPRDRRFIQSAGPFTLEPGAVNYITTGVVWARANQGGVAAGIELMKLADDKAQALFDNCFKLINGPDAPDLTIRELDKEIIIALINTDTATVEGYHEKDPTIVGVPEELKFFDFQGYQVFQLLDATVSVADLKNPDKARLVFQADIRDSVTQLVNFSFDPNLNANIPVEEVNGVDEGISHTIRITRDLFAQGSPNLINHKTYFYTALSYAYNNYETYNQNDPNALDGQKKPYLAGRNNVRTYTAIPHIPTVENNGQTLNSEFGSGPKIKRIEGQGNGGQVLDFTEASEQELLSPPYRSFQPVYRNGRGPVNVKVYDPVLLPDAGYEVRFDGVDSGSFWSIAQFSPFNKIRSSRSIGGENEQVLPLWGLSASINTVIEAGKAGAINNAFLEGTIEFADNSKRWLTGVKDVGGDTPQNWISGLNNPSGIINPVDPLGIYETVIDGTWAPVKVTVSSSLGSAGDSTGPLPNSASLAPSQMLLSPSPSAKTGIASVDVVITPDMSKWTRAVVIEMGANASLTEGNAERFSLRKAPSVGKNGQQGDNSVGAQGMSWFPGYAYNLETGERLNIAFGENSSLSTALGSSYNYARDMIWNPSSTVFSAGRTIFGGMHYIYIFGHNGDNPVSDVPMYDSCRFIFTKLDSAGMVSGVATQTLKRAVWKDAMWVTLPLSITGKELLGTDVRVRLRVAKTYRPYAAATELKSNQQLNAGQTYYVSSAPVTYAGTTYIKTGESFVASSASNFTGLGTVTTKAPENNFNPLYTFNTEDIKATSNDKEVAKKALDLINVVPNPYYAFSAYEGTAGVTGQIDNRIKIVNLPAKCTVSIFTISGTLIRRFERDAAIDNSPGGDIDRGNTEISIDWDLKNTRGIAIASGIYLIHVDAGELGERTIKWFGLLRPIDLDTF